MKTKLITLSLAGALALGGAVAIQAQGPKEHGPGHHGHGGPKMEFAMEHLTKDLDLTAQQQAQVAPIVEQAKPQIRAIHEEAMQKAHAVLQASAEQIRPLLTPEQQAKFDKIRAAHAKMREAMEEMDAAKAD